MHLFTGDYSFFDYKYNIPGYTGQDYGGSAQYLYLAISLILLAVLLYMLRRASQSRIRRIIGCLGIFLTVLYVLKTVWESYYDIRLAGGFNIYLLPLDTCSLIMPAGILAGFGKGRVQKLAACWIATGGIVGGIASMLFLNAFRYYPFLSFGAVYSMLWHFLMVFMGLLVLFSRRGDLGFSIVTDGYLFHLIPSAFVIPADIVFGLDFMLYRDLGGIPFFEGLASRLKDMGLWFLNPVMMLILYLVAFCFVRLIACAALNRQKRV